VSNAHDDNRDRESPPYVQPKEMLDRDEALARYPKPEATEDGGEDLLKTIEDVKRAVEERTIVTCRAIVSKAFTQHQAWEQLGEYLDRVMAKAKEGT